MWGDSGGSQNPPWHGGGPAAGPWPGSKPGGGSGTPAWPSSGPGPAGPGSGGWSGPTSGGGPAGPGGWSGPTSGGGPAGPGSGGWPGPASGGPAGPGPGGWPGPASGGPSGPGSGGWPGPASGGPAGPGPGGWPGPASGGPAGPGPGGWPGPASGGQAGPGPGGWPSPGSGHSGHKTLRVPYSENLPNGVYDKLLITICGTVNSNAEKFAVDLSKGRDIAFHFNPRFNENRKTAIVRNSFIEGKWGREEREMSHFPFVRGQSFEIKILCTSHEFKVAVNNCHLMSYQHRLKNLRSINHLAIHNDITLSQVKTETLP